VKKGFTLIELLVVIALIGILSTLVLANLNSARERSRDAQRKSDLRSIQTALRLYYNDKGSYLTAYGYLVFGLDFIGPDGTVYMQKAPQDPLYPTQSYRYTDVDDDNYILEACLENKSDDKAVDTTDKTWCPSGKEYIAKP